MRDRLDMPNPYQDGELEGALALVADDMSPEGDGEDLKLSRRERRAVLGRSG